MEGPGTSRLTPWVGRLMIVNAVVLLLLSTVFTDPRFVSALAFDPANFLSRPWTALTYMFVHGGLLHLGFNTLMLFVFGPPVERRLGGRTFITFYLYAGVGAALFSLGMSGVLPVNPLVGSSGALFGVMAAFVLHWPQAELAMFPFPLPMSARSIFFGLVVFDALIGVMAATLGTASGIAHFAHVGGAAAGYLFFRLQAFTTPKPPPRPINVARRPVVTPMRMHEAVTEVRPAAPPIEHHGPDFSEEAVDRLLEKISRFGIASLTSQERQFLSDASERKRKGQS
jgi:rhomboid family protein